MIRSLALSLALAVVGSGAAALCSSPGAIGNDDTVIQFSNQSASGSMGALGTKSRLNSRLPGTVYYDHASKSLKLCDGANWVTIQDSSAGAAGAGASSFPPWSVWSRSSGVMGGGSWTAPVDNKGTYKVTLDLAPGGGACNASLGSKVMLSKLADAGSGNTAAHATYTLYGQSDGSYYYSLESKGGSRDGQNKPEYVTPAVSGSLTWNGDVSITCPSSSVSIMRIE
jgi:hypothetical protein